MRALTPTESHAIQWFVGRVSESEGQRLLEDVENAMVEEIRSEHLTLRFHVWGYPPTSFEDTYPAAFAIALDTDGANLAVTLWLDLEGGLHQLNVFRLETGPVQDPDWASIRVAAPEEFARLMKESGTDKSTPRSRANRWLRRLTGRCT